jgi:hypothetical protein
MRRSTIIFIFITAGVGLGLFQLKYQVMTLEQHHRQIRYAINQTKEAIHVLKAEWAHLNDPVSLQRLCTQYLSIAPIQGSQLVSFHKLEKSGSEVRQLGEEEKADYDQGALDQLVSTLVGGPVVNNDND